MSDHAAGFVNDIRVCDRADVITVLHGTSSVVPSDHAASILGSIPYTQRTGIIAGCHLAAVLSHHAADSGATCRARNRDRTCVEAACHLAFKVISHDAAGIHFAADRAAEGAVRHGAIVCADYAAGKVAAGHIAIYYIDILHRAAAAHIAEQAGAIAGGVYRKISDCFSAAVKGTLEALAAGADRRPALAAQVNFRAQRDCFSGKIGSVVDQLRQTGQLRGGGNGKFGRAVLGIGIPIRIRCVGPVARRAVARILCHRLVLRRRGLHRHGDGGQLHALRQGVPLRERGGVNIVAGGGRVKRRFRHPCHGDIDGLRLVHALIGRGVQRIGQVRPLVRAVLRRLGERLPRHVRRQRVKRRDRPDRRVWLHRPHRCGQQGQAQHQRQEDTQPTFFHRSLPFFSQNDGAPYHRPWALCPGTALRKAVLFSRY